MRLKLISTELFQKYMHHSLATHINLTSLMISLVISNEPTEQHKSNDEQWRQTSEKQRKLTSTTASLSLVAVTPVNRIVIPDLSGSSFPFLST